MKIGLIEPFYGGSHRQWADGLKRHSKHDFQLFTMPALHWKWRMHGSAVTMAQKLRETEGTVDLLLVSDMLDLATFKSLIGDQRRLPIALYMHENQLTYPWSVRDREKLASRDHTYAFKNYMSTLAADGVIFNSRFHLDSFLKALPEFLRRFPDFKGEENIERIRSKSQVIQPGLDPGLFIETEKETNLPPIILWNHRWEYDKNPDEFFSVLFDLANKGLDFELVILGEQYAERPEVFDRAKEQLGKRVIHFGYAKSRSTYLQWLSRCDILPVTSNQEFFGISAAEAIASGCLPLLPNRLAFPELIPESLHSELLYKDSSDLLKKLHLMLEGHQSSWRSSLKAHLVPLSWESQIKQYDQLFETMVDINRL